MNECWSPVVGWENYYEVSSLGKVRSLPRKPGIGIKKSNLVSREITPKPDRTRYGHHKIILYANGKEKTTYVHTLVLEAFVGPKPDGMECCHNDGNPSNNCVDNLRWDTRSNNTFDSVKHGTHPASRKTHCKHGHLYDQTNTYWHNGQRTCITCRDKR